jgi:ferritin-like metal-binding protein YciE
MTTETARSIYVTALRNTHALEEQSLQVMERQVERLEHYPDMERALRQHIAETKQQRERLEEALASLDEGPSTLKESVLGIMGNMAAAAHTPAQDEILKNTFANHALENYEITAYKSLLVIAEAANQSNFQSAFQQSLKEEQAMARQMYDVVEAITREYLSRTVGGDPSSAKV